ncbi:unnamed protein product, partial [Rotaria magnacalcarata]
TILEIDLSRNTSSYAAVLGANIQLRNNRAVTYLNLENSKIDSQNVQLLVAALIDNQIFNRLKLHDNESRLCTLAEIFLTAPRDQVRTELNVAGQRIGHEETVQRFDLRESTIGSLGAQYLADALREDTVLMILILRENTISDEGLEHLASALNTNKTLNILDLSWTKIKTSSRRYLMNTFQCEQNLTTIDFTGNSQGDCAVIGIAIVIRNNKVSIATLDLHSNEITENGAELLAKILHRNGTLTTLLMGNNKVGDNGAKYLADVLHNNRVSFLCCFPVEYPNSIVLHVGIEYIGSKWQ